MMLTSLFFVCLIYPILTNNQTISKHHHFKRALLVYPNGGTFKFVVAIAIPIEIGSKQSLSYSVNFQFQYQLPQNYSEFDNDWVNSLKERRRRSKSNLEIPQQQIFYATIEETLKRHGLSGRSCLLNLICEISKDPYPALTLYDQIFRKLLLPSQAILDDLEYVEYLEATRAGKYGADCNSLYYSCPINENFISYL